MNFDVRFGLRMMGGVEKCIWFDFHWLEYESDIFVNIFGVRNKNVILETKDIFVNMDTFEDWNVNLIYRTTKL